MRTRRHRNRRAANRTCEACGDRIKRRAGMQHRRAYERLFVRVDEIFFDTERPLGQHADHLSLAELTALSNLPLDPRGWDLTDLKFYNLSRSNSGGAAMAEFEWEVPADRIDDVDAHKAEAQFFLEELKDALESYLGQRVEVSAHTLVLGDREMNVNIKAR